MNLYATITSERASKGQGGKELRIDVKDKDKLTFLELLILPPDEVMGHPLVSILGTTYEVARQLEGDARGIAENALHSSDNFGKLDLLTPAKKAEKQKAKKVKCSACGGLGNCDEQAGFPLDCQRCGGTGYITK